MANSMKRVAAPGELRLTDFAHSMHVDGREGLVLVRAVAEGPWIEIWRGLPGTPRAMSTTYNLALLNDDEIDDQVRSAMHELAGDGFLATDQRPPLGTPEADWYLDACRYGLPRPTKLAGLRRSHGPALELRIVDPDTWRQLLAEPNMAVMPTLLSPSSNSAVRAWLVLPEAGSSYVCSPTGDDLDLPLPQQALLCAGGRAAPEHLRGTIIELEVAILGGARMPWPRVVPIDVVDFRGLSGAQVEYGERLYQLQTVINELREAWGVLPGWEDPPAMIRKEAIDASHRRWLTLRRLDAVYAGEISDAWVRQAA